MGIGLNGCRREGLGGDGLGGVAVAGGGGGGGWGGRPEYRLVKIHWISVRPSGLFGRKAEDGSRRYKRKNVGRST